MAKGTFITLEGTEGSGKTTQGKLLVKWLSAHDYAVIYTREPGGTYIGEQIRNVLLSKDNFEIIPEAEFLLFSASRAQHTARLILPALKSGISVICDRYADSSLAYQGRGRGLGLETLCNITTFATFGLKPDITLYFDLSPEKGVLRKNKRNRIDSEKISFHQQVRAGYLSLVEKEPNRWVVIDANNSIDIIQNQIREIVSGRIA